MDVEAVIQVLDALDEADVRYWVGGGWGVAALAGRQTRHHRDLDLAVDARDLARCLESGARLGYAAETDWLPVRIELSAPGDRWVDVHPVEFDENGASKHVVPVIIQWQNGAPSTVFPESVATSPVTKP